MKHKCDVCLTEFDTLEELGKHFQEVGAVLTATATTRSMA